MISAEDARLYAECQVRHAGAVNAYRDARKSALDFNAASFRHPSEK